MEIRIGFDLLFEFSAETALVLLLNVHPSRAFDLLRSDKIETIPALPSQRYVDRYGNICTRLLAPAGTLALRSDSIILDSGKPDIVMPDARQYRVDELPNDKLQFLLPSRYCETDRLMEIAWSLFAGTPEGWPRVQAICDFVHSHIRFDYRKADPKKSAYDVYLERAGVCRDFAHLAIGFCRCMNIPARYCTGYLGDIGVPSDPSPMDFSAWFEAFLSGEWFTFDARHNIPRVGRILLAKGRDAGDVPILTSFGPHVLKKFEVTTCQLDRSEKKELLLPKQIAAVG